MELKDISIYWLIDKVITKKHTDSELNHIFNQAKAMHKEEVQDALEAGYQIANEDVKFKHIHTAEQYYNETFGGEQ